MDNVHRHTDACLKYAATTGQPHCIAECRDSYHEHAAEVAWLRSVLQEITKCPNGKSKNWSEIDELVRAALAAPPTAAVEAVEGMRRALEAWNNYAQYLGPAAIPQYQQSCDALAAYEEATRG